MVSFITWEILAWNSCISVFTFQIAKIVWGQIWQNWWMVKFCYWFVGWNLLENDHVMNMGISTKQDPSTRSKYLVFYNKQPHILLPIFPSNNAILLFHILQTLYEQCPSDQGSINTVFSWFHGMCAFSGIAATEVFACFDISFLDCTASTMIHHLWYLYLQTLFHLTKCW